MTKNRIRIGAQRQDLAPSSSPDLGILRLRHGALQHLADGIQEVPGCEHDAEGRNDGEGLDGAEGSQQDIELADEPVQPRQARRRQRYHDEKDPEDRNRLPETAEVVQHAGVPRL